MKAQSALDSSSTPSQSNNSAPKSGGGKPRLRSPYRGGYMMVSQCLDDMIPNEHLVRDVWQYVEGLNLSIVLGKIQSVEGAAGRPAIDPQVLLTLWIYATLKGIGSSRVIEELCINHNVYKWICGGVRVNYHSISDFRTKHGDLFSDLLTQSVAILASAGCINLEKVSQDGVRVRANAGASSFKRKPTLEDQLTLAKILVDDLKLDAEKNPRACRDRHFAAEKRVAEDRLSRINCAFQELDKVKAIKENSSKKEQRNRANEARASMTDPEARVMKMACMGFRPAHNIQFATTVLGKAIIGVSVTNSGSDQEQTLGMIEQVEARYGKVPKKWLQDGGYKNEAQLTKVGIKYKDCVVYMPVTKIGDEADLHKRRPKDNEIVGKWRERMGTTEAKEIYKDRAATSELVNAQARNRNLQQLPVRGIAKVTCLAFLFALAHNVMTTLNM